MARNVLYGKIHKSPLSPERGLDPPVCDVWRRGFLLFPSRSQDVLLGSSSYDRERCRPLHDDGGRRFSCGRADSPREDTEIRETRRRSSARRTQRTARGPSLDRGGLSAGPRKSDHRSPSLFERVTMQIADIDFCTPHDLNELYEIEKACFQFPWERRVMENDLANLGDVIYMKASFDLSIAGYGVLARRDGMAHLLNLAVLKEFRRMRVGSQLMIAFEEIAMGLWRCSRMRLEVASSNRPARDFYARLGFAYVMRMRSYYGNGDDALVLLARLPLRIR